MFIFNQKLSGKPPVIFAHSDWLLLSKLQKKCIWYTPWFGLISKPHIVKCALSPTSQNLPGTIVLWLDLHSTFIQPLIPILLLAKIFIKLHARPRMLYESTHAVSYNSRHGIQFLTMQQVPFVRMRLVSRKKS